MIFAIPIGSRNPSARVTTLAGKRVEEAARREQRAQNAHSKNFAKRKLRITQLSDILNSPKYEIMLPLSPYVAVVAYPRIGPAPSSRPQTVEPSQVRKPNNLLRGQSKIFTIARDKESLK